ncbi:uncharacterized protein LOC134696615 [Mytilus trossulus]|uniref:uncharacterized protein LOC134696615 n=1 Tax=Mytilus trossulus TaxID=6551 RepID=UPI003006F95D
MFRLMSNVAPKAVRDLFNQHYKPSSLIATLARDKAKITNHLLNRHIISRKQMDLLYPTSGITSSENYDITLMICLLRNMTNILQPCLGYDKLPPVTETSDGADLARIKYYRNFMAHTETDELSNEDFNTMWICITKAIIRIGGVKYKPKFEDLSQINLNRDILTYIRQDLCELRGEISNQIGTLKSQTAITQTSITLLHSKCSAQGKDMKLITKKVTTQIEDLALEIKKYEDDTIPKNIRAQHQQYLDEWKKDDHMFVVTKATKYVKSFLKYKRKNVVVVTGSSGTGKSSIIHHIALELCFKYGYEVIPFVTGPQDIINFRDPTTKQVFVVDDICGKEAINVSLVELWRDHSGKLAKIFEVNEEGKNNLSCTQMSSPKLLVSCRLHLYRDVHVKLLKLTLFKRSQCNLLSTELRLSNAEKMRMVKRYIPGKMCYSWGRETFDFFPLLCKLAVRKNSDEIKKLFLSPVDTIKDDLTQFITWQNNYQLCALVLCILFLNGFNPDWLKLEYAPILERDKIKNVVDECGININLERERECLQCCFESLELTYLKKFGNMYIMIHDKINEIAAFLYGQYLKECFIKYAPTSFVRDHYRFQSFERKENNKIIMLSENMEGEYLNRLIRDMKHGHIVSTLSNKNLVIDTIRAEIIKAFQHDPDVRLAMKQHSSSMYSVPIMEAAAQGFADIVKVLIDLKYVECDVNFSNWCWATPLFAACEGGHTAVVKLLLENGAKFYGYGEHGWSLLQVSCSKGHIGVVELLLQKSFGFFKKKKKKRSNRVTAYAAREKIGNYLNLSKVDDQGRSTLFLACKEGHTNIVKLLLDRNADPLKSNDRGQSPLMSACKKKVIKI